MRYALLFSLMLLSCCLQAQPEAAYQAEYFASSSGDTLPYRILYPEGYSSSTDTLPLVLFLHGAGERGEDNSAQLTHGAQLFLDSMSQYPAIVVFPQCGSGSYWVRIERQADDLQMPFYEAPVSDMGMVIELLAQLQAQERIDPSRIYLAGLSMGGFGTFELLARLPRTFAAAVPICGGGNKLLAPLYAQHTPMWIFHGDADSVVSVDLSRKMYKALAEAGGQPKYTEYPEVGHNSWDPAFAEPELLKWLFSHRLSRRP